VAEIGFQVGLGIFLLGYISKYIKNCETSARLVVTTKCSHANSRALTGKDQHTMLSHSTGQKLQTCLSLSSSVLLYKLTSLLT